MVVVVVVVVVVVGVVASSLIVTLLCAGTAAQMVAMFDVKVALRMYVKKKGQNVNSCV